MSLWWVAGAGAALYLWWWTTYASYRILHPNRSGSPLPAEGWAGTVEARTVHTHDGFPLPYWLIHPPQPKGLLITCHGYWGSKIQAVPVAQPLVRAGYAVILWDLRGHGEHPGRACTWGRDEVKDLLRLLEQLQRDPVFGALPVGVLGYSMGAAVALLTLAQTTRLRAAIVDSTYAHVGPLIRRYFRRVRRLPDWPFGHLACLGVAWRLRLPLERFDPLTAIPSTEPRPLFLIHGDADRSVPVAEAWAICQAWRGPKAFWRMASADHMQMQERYREAYERKIIAFLDRHLASGAPFVV
ncbi:MAG: alpha/beta fold hydrolase [Candidatus Omnitrophica bacterium]|nr:alpha/beta fold hydrolase [Candidatus Omnitrophota bacterium]